MGTWGRWRYTLLGCGALLLSCVVVIAATAGARGASGTGGGVVGPSLHVTGNGHFLHPLGTRVTVGDFPDGSAVTPDGKYDWIVDCGHGIDDAKIIDIAAHKVIQTLPLPGCYGGVAIAPDGTHAYISGEPLAGNPTDGPTKGDSGDVIHVFTVDTATGLATEQNPLTIPATSGGTARTNSLPPVSGVGTEYPEGMAVSPDGKYLVVALNGADRADIVNLAANDSQTTVSIGEYPEGVAFDPQGRAYVSNEYSGTVSVIDPATATVTATISKIGGSLGDLNSHPEGMVADPHRDRLYVAVTGRDLVDVVNTDTDQVVAYLSVGRPQGLGTEPVAVAISPDDSTLYSADAGEDALAAISLSQRPAAPRKHKVFVHPTIKSIRFYLKTHKAKYLTARSRLACAGPTVKQITTFEASIEKSLRGPGKLQGTRNGAALKALPAIRGCAATYIPNLPAYKLIGKIPTAAYPDSVQTTPQGKLLWVAGKGFGSGPNPTYYFGGSPLAPGQTPTNAYGTYVLDKLIGTVGITAVPTDYKARGDSKTADAQAVPDDPETQPANSPIPATFGTPSSQIKHVFYIVRENRTYDQIFGSDPRGDGDPQLELFDNNGVSGLTGGITPNAHALATRFPLFDNFYEDSEVSVDGHLITAGAEATDYVQKATAANYSGRRGTYDMGIYPVTAPPNFYIFDQAQKAGITYEDYGEAVGALPMDAAPNRPDFTAVLSHVDQAYPNNLFIGCLKAGVAATCTHDSGVYDGTGSVFAGQSRFTQWLPTFETQVTAGNVPTFNYMILPEDHTNGTTTGDPTPQADIADNDLGLGQIVDAISHSNIWSSSAIFVVEDDSQDGADHVDSHRAPAFVISPWAQQGTVDNTRYDQYSVLKTIELITGMQPLELTDALATPMYDAFISGDQKPNDAPYKAIEPTYSLTTMNSASAADAKLSNELPWNQMDQVPQAISDQILWQAVHGADSTPPAAGPNASPEEVMRGVAMRKLLKAAHPVKATTSSRKWSKSTACPISWACYRPPAGTN